MYSDEGPLLGPGPIRGLWLACGHHRNGVLLAAITSELLSSALTERQTFSSPDENWLQHFRWDRFRTSI